MKKKTKESPLKNQETKKQTYDLAVDRCWRGKCIINGFVETISNIELDNNFSHVIDHLLSCKGKTITIGMGKAGIAMRKFSSTLCSLGFPSCYLHPGEALHGDIGLISKNDILFVASTSGKTREVLEFIDLVKNFPIKCIIGITSHPDSPLRNKVDIILDMGEIEEEGNLKIAPTSSILAMLAITDSLALVASEEKNLTLEEYGKYHHGGYLGAKARNDGKIY